MSDNSLENITELEEYEDDDELDHDDFSFIIGSDGNLKSMSIPKHLMDDPPEEVKMILEMFGIDDIHQIGVRILH